MVDISRFTEKKLMALSINAVVLILLVTMQSGEPYAKPVLKNNSKANALTESARPFPTGTFKQLADPETWQDNSGKWHETPKSQRATNVLFIKRLNIGGAAKLDAKSDEYLVNVEYTMFATRYYQFDFAGIFRKINNSLVPIKGYQKLGCDLKIHADQQKIYFSDPNATCREFSDGGNVDGIWFKYK